MKSFLMLLLTTAWLASACAQSTQPAPAGLALYSFRNELKADLPGTLAKVKAFGFRDVEVYWLFDLSAADFRKLLEKNGLKAVSLIASFEDLNNNVPKVVADAKNLGVKYVVCTSIPHAGDTFTQRDADDAIDAFNTAGKLLAENDLTFCYHPHGFEFQPYQTGTFFDYLAQNLDPKYSNFEMDVFWVKHPGQDPVTLLQKYPKRFLLSHLKDRRPGTPGNQTGHAEESSNVALGQGDVGIAAFMKAAHKAGIKYHFIEDESPRAMEQMGQSLDFLRSLK